jgi:hypothetical protein
MHEERNNKHSTGDEPIADGAVPTYLLDRENQSRAKVLSNMIKQKRKEKAGKWQVPLPKVKGMDEAEVFRVVKSGKRKCKGNTCFKLRNVSSNHFIIYSKGMETYDYKGYLCRRRIHS